MTGRAQADEATNHLSRGIGPNNKPPNNKR